MKGAQSISTRRAYGVQRICRVWGRARSSVYARRHATRARASRRRGPVGAAPDAVLVGHIRRVLEASPFHGEGYRKAWAKLRVAGIRTSKERVRRLMREHDLQAPHRVGHAHGPKAHDGTITTEAPDAMWGTDMTATVTIGEGSAFVFVAVDHCTTECIGLHAAKSGSRFEALEPIRQGVRERFGAIGKGVAHGLRLRHDHGSTYLADDFQQEVAFFGIESSPSFVREPEGNGVAERFIRTLKENVLWVRSFDTIEALRLAVLAFKRTYNEHWMLERYDYRSPAQVRRDLVGLDAAAAVIPNSRDTDSRFSPRSRRSTVARLRRAENRPFRSRSAAGLVALRALSAAVDSSTCFLISTLLLRELSRNQVSKKTLGRRRRTMPATSSSA